MPVNVSNGAAALQLRSLHLDGVYSATLRSAAENEFGYDDPNTLVLDDDAALALEEAVASRHRQLLTEGTIEVYRSEVGGAGCRMAASAFPGVRRFRVTSDDTVIPVEDAVLTALSESPWRPT